DKPMIMASVSPASARRLYSTTTLSTPRFSSMKFKASGWPLIPPCSLISSTNSSAAFWAGTPKTAPGPDKKVDTPILMGSWAKAEADTPSATADRLVASQRKFFLDMVLLLAKSINTVIAECLDYTLSLLSVNNIYLGFIPNMTIIY